MQRDQAQRAQAGTRDRNNFTQGNGSNNNRPDANRGNDNRGGNENRGGNDRGNFGRNDNNNRPDFNRGNDNRGNNFGRNDNRPGSVRNDSRWNQYHRSFNAPHRFQYRGPTYHRPPGFTYRRWSYGEFLPSLFWGSSYWINNSSYYDLMPAPPGTVWVRYGDDAVLIDRYTGEVIQVEYSVFY